ncbi:hypothetical protein [Streptomyces sp. NPDC048710]
MRRRGFAAAAAVAVWGVPAVGCGSGSAGRTMKYRSFVTAAHKAYVC